MPSRLVHMTTFHLYEEGQYIVISTDGGVSVICSFSQLAEVCKAMHEAHTIVESDHLRLAITNKLEDLQIEIDGLKTRIEQLEGALHDLEPDIERLFTLEMKVERLEEHLNTFERQNNQRS